MATLEHPGILPRLAAPSKFCYFVADGNSVVLVWNTMSTKVSKHKRVGQVEPESQDGYNLQGQRLGRKGQETRERILVAALRLIETSPDSMITLSAVAREISVRMPNLYLYFPDLGELVLACLIRVMDSADEAYMDRLRSRWPEDALELHVLGFLRAHFQFWQQHTRILHMRNSFADVGDSRFVKYRRTTSAPLIELVIQQMDGRPEERDTRRADLATVILAGFERLATVVTAPSFHGAAEVAGIVDEDLYVERLLAAEAELITPAIRHQRALAKSTSKVKPRKC